MFVKRKYECKKAWPFRAFLPSHSSFKALVSQLLSPPWLTCAVTPALSLLYLPAVADAAGSLTSEMLTVTKYPVGNQLLTMSSGEYVKGWL